MMNLSSLSKSAALAGLAIFACLTCFLLTLNEGSSALQIASSGALVSVLLCFAL
ncbi:hypothetical protein SAMN04515695_0449 [Pseudovibrio sp. Tun.PSC04-5.I4]|nr:hypothetical protein SAMN04515695_0449 [Pseudovibrio sp. Tun.PSC04-5.I4]